MPIYEYECKQCNERMEIIQRISDPPFTHCPKCGSEVRKLFSSPAIQFRGSGFYKTDYASSRNAGSSSKESSSSETKESAGSSAPAEGGKTGQ